MMAYRIIARTAVCCGWMCDTVRDERRMIDWRWPTCHPVKDNILHSTVMIFLYWSSSQALSCVTFVVTKRTSKTNTALNDSKMFPGDEWPLGAWPFTLFKYTRGHSAGLSSVWRRYMVTSEFSHSLQLHHCSTCTTLYMYIQSI